ncbi:hypothetical protein ACQKWADRAFT_292250 [Trichoderma austrokoningii]
MEAAGNAATSILYTAYNLLVRAGEFEDEFERHQLKLDTLKMRLAGIRTVIEELPEELPEERRMLLAQILDNSQRIFVKAQQDAAKIRAGTARTICKMQWAIYKRDRCDRSIADIDVVVAGLEKLVGGRH